MFANHPLYGPQLLVPLGPESIPPAASAPPSGVVVASYLPQRPPNGVFAPTSLSLPSEYRYDSRPECITVRRRDLERCLRTTIEQTMCTGGIITALARSCMEALDREEEEAQASRAGGERKGEDGRAEVSWHDDVVYI